MSTIITVVFGPGTLGLVLEDSSAGIFIAGLTEAASVEAQRALRRGDFLCGVNDTAVRSAERLRNAVEIIMAAPRPVLLTFRRRVAATAAAAAGAPPAKRQRHGLASAATKSEPIVLPRPPPRAAPRCADASEAQQLLLLTNLGFDGEGALAELRAAGGHVHVAALALRARAIRALEDRRFDEQVNAAQLLSERARAEEKERRRRERELQLMAGDFATVFAQSVVLRSSSTARALLRAASDGVQSMEDVAVASASGDGCGGGGSLRALDLELRSALLQLFKVEEKAIRWWPTAARCYAEWLGAQIDSAARRLRGDADADAATKRCLETIESNQKELTRALYEMPHANGSFAPPALLRARCPAAAAVDGVIFVEGGRGASASAAAPPTHDVIDLT